MFFIPTQCDETSTCEARRPQHSSDVHIANYQARKTFSLFLVAQGTLRARTCLHVRGSSFILLLVTLD